jgi:hypothetical protein
LAEQSLDPEHASQHIGPLCWKISRSTIAGALGFLTFTQCGQRPEREFGGWSLGRSVFNE